MGVVYLITLQITGDRHVLPAGMCVLAHACLLMCMFVHSILGLLPLSPPDIPLPVTVACCSQIRPSSTFLLPVAKLPSILHQFHPAAINRGDNQTK